MLTVRPDYYADFHCLADRCRHTCCAGWEIDIDPEALRKYRAVPGALGDKLRRSVAEGETPHFLLTDRERCPFLTENDLCELILAGGEDMLCRICRDHPRWRSFLPGRTEEGVGLCCEAAAALVLSRTEPVRLIPEGTEGPEDADARALIDRRDAIVAAAQDRSQPLLRRMEAILAMCRAERPAASLRSWAAFYRSLERLDEGWSALLDRLEENGDLVDITQVLTSHEIAFEQLLVYFLHRHFLKAYDDGDVTSKAAFAVLSTRVLLALAALHREENGEVTRSDIAEYARMYSAEIEYSDENLDALFDALYTETP